MKLKFLLTLFLTLSFEICAFAGESELIKENSIQTKINQIGTNILNSNGLEKRVIFVYDPSDKKALLKDTKTFTKRQIVVYKNDYKYIENDDELAAYISREIPIAIRSYVGGKGILSSVKIKAAPKKYELVSDKLAVDYMVKAGYNPLGLITYINKSCPQLRQDTISNKNLTSKRLAYIYEKIYTQYPSFLINNAYINNPNYQNFLLTSRKNREILKEKIKNEGDLRKLKYE